MSDTSRDPTQKRGQKPHRFSPLEGRSELARETAMRESRQTQRNAKNNLGQNMEQNKMPTNPPPQANAIKAGFYLVASPIGNLRDITFRALDVLSAVDLIVCEDTRVTGKLMSAYSFKKKMQVYNITPKQARRRVRLLWFWGKRLLKLFRRKVLRSNYRPLCNLCRFVMPPKWWHKPQASQRKRFILWR